MSQIFIDPGFSEKPDLVFCSEKCVADYGLDLNAPDSNLFPIDEERFEVQKDVMGWANTCSACGKPITK